MSPDEFVTLDLVHVAAGSIYRLHCRNTSPRADVLEYFFAHSRSIIRAIPRKGNELYCEVIGRDATRNVSVALLHVQMCNFAQVVVQNPLADQCFHVTPHPRNVQHFQRMSRVSRAGRHLRNEEMQNGHSHGASSNAKVFQCWPVTHVVKELVIQDGVFDLQRDEVFEDVACPDRCVFYQPRLGQVGQPDLKTV